MKNNFLYPFVVQNEKEDAIAAMWRHVALNSKAPEDQLSAYQNAIEALEVSIAQVLRLRFLFVIFL